MSSKCKCGGYVGQYPDECLACWDRAKLCVSACAPLSDPTTSIPALLRVAEAARELHKAADSLLARVITLDPTFMPSRCREWAAIVESNAALSALPARDERGGA